MNWFGLRKKKLIKGDVVDLLFDRMEEPNDYNLYVPSYYFHIVIHDSRQKVGSCDLRVGMNEELYYAGNIGYRIFEPYRSHHYSYYACRLLMAEAKNTYGMEELLITCSPDNIASKKILERLGGELIEETDVPVSHWLYKRGEMTKLIYRYTLK